MPGYAHYCNTHDVSMVKGGFAYTEYSSDFSIVHNRFMERHTVSDMILNTQYPVLPTRPY